ncbi:hypothetical protein K431DRAFT_108186 [Polychaeton citri CBS 116435]|uniref:Secreted protein n=1 Tax=Polychaeton citri CBS 116435 TaxID=1314669 RepID=A0A9P4Q7R4_9PEZI|nr:hypothetical protein K431DRAFT_108186 [Polychaeton citri CBS 116435]
MVVAVAVAVVVVLVVLVTVWCRCHSCATDAALSCMEKLRIYRGGRHDGGRDASLPLPLAPMQPPGVESQEDAGRLHRSSRARKYCHVSVACSVTQSHQTSKTNPPNREMMDAGDKGVPQTCGSRAEAIDALADPSHL